MTKKEILKQIRLKCLECSCGSSHEVKLCRISDCPVYSLRFGTDPTRRRLTDAEKQALSARLHKTARVPDAIRK